MEVLGTGFRDAAISIGWWSTGAGCSLHRRCPTSTGRRPGQPPAADSTTSSGAGWDGSAEVPATLSSAGILWDASWKCLEDDVLDTPSLQNNQPSQHDWQSVYSVTPGINKQERTNLYLCRGLQLHVQLKTRALHVTCQLPSKIFQCLLTHFNRWSIIWYFFRLFCCCCRNMRLAVSKTISRFYRRNQGRENRNPSKATTAPGLACIPRLEWGSKQRKFC